MNNVLVAGDELPKTSLKAKKYSPFPLDSYDVQRHIPLEKAYSLVKDQNNSNLNPEFINQSIQGGDLAVYNFNGHEYVDRLDIGRVYHSPKESRGVKVQRFFSREGEDVFESFGRYAPRDLAIKSKSGKNIFEMKGALFPEQWTDEEARIVAQKYFFRPNREEWKEKIKAKIGKTEENSPKDLINRVSNFFADKGWELGYFASEQDRENFREELKFLQAHRMAAFNSPVYFNVGIYNEYGIEGPPAISFVKDPITGEVRADKGGCYVNPVGHACFIRAARDNLVSILQQTVDEGSIFSHGSGCGGDIGALREKDSSLGGGGKPSGPRSFMDIFDKAAGIIKSGGKSRRAARMQTMYCTHPDIEEFVIAKVGEDKKALTLIKNGYESGMDGEAYRTVAFQNTNLSVRVTKEFFEAIKTGKKIPLISVNRGIETEQISPELLLQKIAFGAWRIGDPGLQYDGVIQDYHTCPLSGRINSSNPCGEYIFVDDSSCNLASTNLLAFTDKKGKFDANSFSRANRIIAIAQDIMNRIGAYPVRDIAVISPEFATIGLGYANLGAALMRKGLAYDSDEGRAFASSVTALMTGTAYETSTELAENLGTFVHFELNKNPMLNVIKKHKKNLEDIAWKHVDEDVKKSIYSTWTRLEDRGEKFGFRNAQVSVIAPTGTISYIMGCDTTGCESAYELITRKFLAGGGELTLVNKEVPNALENLGYSPEEVELIQSHIIQNNSVVGCPDIKPEHRKIFATARVDQNQSGSIPFEGHIKMVAAIQPYVSGGISKTMNLPEHATVKNIYDGFMLGYQLGLKGLTAFRDNSKPISALGDQRSFKELKRGEKEDLPASRAAHEFELTIANNGGEPQPFHMIVSEYQNGKPGQITFLAYKGGSSLGSLLKTSGIVVSKSLKRGVFLDDMVEGWIGEEFRPNGMVWGHKHVHNCKSPLDLAAKILLIEYMGRTELADDPSAVDLTTLRGFKNGALRAYEREKIDDWNFNQVMKDAELGGFVESTSKITLAKKGDEKSRETIRCPSCEGNTLRRISSNCYECPCGHKIGGCTS
ncbi:MAG: adenosylcobalamin-dependent ribonucleoside-diphosphate reductase [Candidatus Pacearchaeota archaeon]